MNYSKIKQEKGSTKYPNKSSLMIDCENYNSIMYNCGSSGCNPLSANPIKWSNTLKQFIGFKAGELFECV